jgi:hypothetical protein
MLDGAGPGVSGCCGPPAGATVDAGANTGIAGGGCIAAGDETVRGLTAFGAAFFTIFFLAFLTFTTLAASAVEMDLCAVLNQKIFANAPICNALKKKTITKIQPIFFIIQLTILIITLIQLAFSEGKSPQRFATPQY